MQILQTCNFVAVLFSVLIAQMSVADPTPTPTSNPTPSPSPSPTQDYCPSDMIKGSGIHNYSQTSFYSGTHWPTPWGGCNDAIVASASVYGNHRSTTCYNLHGTPFTSVIVADGVVEPGMIGGTYNTTCSCTGSSAGYQCSARTVNAEFVCCIPVPQDSQSCETSHSGLPNRCSESPQPNGGTCSLEGCGGFDSATCSCTHCQSNSNNLGSYCRDAGDCGAGQTCQSWNYKTETGHIECRNRCVASTIPSPTVTATPTATPSPSPSP